MHIGRYEYIATAYSSIYSIYLYCASQIHAAIVHLVCGWKAARKCGVRGFPSSLRLLCFHVLLARDQAHTTPPFKLIMQDSKPQPPPSDGQAASNGSPGATPPPPVVDGFEGLDPKMTVMGGGEKEKAADYANCEIT